MEPQPTKTEKSSKGTRIITYLALIIVVSLIGIYAMVPKHMGWDETEKQIRHIASESKTILEEVPTSAYSYSYGIISKSEFRQKMYEAKDKLTKIQKQLKKLQKNAHPDFKTIIEYFMDGIEYCIDGLIFAGALDIENAILSFNVATEKFLFGAYLLDDLTS